MLTTRSLRIHHLLGHPIARLSTDSINTEPILLPLNHPIVVVKVKINISALQFAFLGNFVKSAKNRAEIII